MRRIVLVLAGALLAGALVGAGGSMAIAGTANSSSAVFSLNGINYSDYATVGTSSGRAGASTLVKGTNTSVPSGWAGANARLFTTGGALYAQSGFIYNSGSVPAGLYFSQSTGTFTVAGGAAWYSYGVVRAWNGTSYGNYYTFLSPNQSS